MKPEQRKCPKCGEINLSVPTGDGNRVYLCGHVSEDSKKAKL
jgi:hypothetical protein